MANVVRVIARLDIKGPNLIKGIQFDGYRVLGTAEEFAEIYSREGADELIYQDAVASLYRRNSLLEIVSRTASKIFIPLTVAGGIRSVDDVRAILRAGADKVAINTAAVENPGLLSEVSHVFGAQCIVSSIEAFWKGGDKWEVWVDYGREVTGVDALDWARKVEDLGVGEILLTSINREGMGSGYDAELIERVSESVSIPVIACGGSGRVEDLVSAVRAKADAVAAASMFHYHFATPKRDRATMQLDRPDLRMGKPIDSGNIDFLNRGYGGEWGITVDPISIGEAKKHIAAAGIPVRLVENRLA